LEIRSKALLVVVAIVLSWEKNVAAVGVVAQLPIATHVVVAVVIVVWVIEVVVVMVAVVVVVIVVVSVDCTGVGIGGGIEVGLEPGVIVAEVVV
jgi:hypothetical protein